MVRWGACTPAHPTPQREEKKERHAPCFPSSVYCTAGLAALALALVVALATLALLLLGAADWGWLGAGDGCEGGGEGPVALGRGL